MGDSSSLITYSIVQASQNKKEDFTSIVLLIIVCIWEKSSNIVHVLMKHFIGQHIVKYHLDTVSKTYENTKHKLCNCSDLVLVGRKYLHMNTAVPAQIANSSALFHKVTAFTKLGRDFSASKDPILNLQFPLPPLTNNLLLLLITRATINRVAG